MKPRNKRLLFAAVVLAGLGAATLLVMNAFESNLVFFYTPTQVQAGETPGTRVFRVGGLVEAGSVKRDGIAVQFKVTDTVHSMPVNFEGPLPDLFKEGKGVVAQGRMVDGIFKAQEVLAKHDENYMPPEAAEALKRAQSGGSMPAPTSGAKP
jgi:cytochrome c-type biogenesis protein CcmE